MIKKHEFEVQPGPEEISLVLRKFFNSFVIQRNIKR